MTTAQLVQAINSGNLTRACEAAIILARSTQLIDQPGRAVWIIRDQEMIEITRDNGVFVAAIYDEKA